MVYGTTAVTGCSPVSGGVLLSLSYPRDANGQITAENGTGYGYDPINRLTSAGSDSYTIDKADQITQQPFPSAATTSFTYDAANQLKTGTVSGGGPSYTYNFDAAGNRRTRVDAVNNTLTYSYDQVNRLTSFVADGPTPPTYSYAYNGDGLRTTSSINGSPTASYTWDLAEGLPLLLSDGSASYVTGPGGLPIESVSASGVLYFYQADQLGSTRLITDATGTSVSTYTYDAYGNLSASTGTLANPFQYAGQYLDAESGLYYLRARYYDPTTGQFISRDPLGTLTRTPYTYVADSPLNGSDPGGLFFGAFALPGGGVFIGGTAGAGLCVFGGCEALAVVAAAAGAVLLGYEIGTAGNQLLDAADPGLTAGAAWIGSNVLNAKKSKSSDAERSTDRPSWAGEPIPEDTSGKDYAKRQCDAKYGAGAYKTGPGSEYQKLQKWFDRRNR